MNHKSKFFLFRMVDSQKNLERDEPSFITRIIFLSAFVLLIIDLLVVLFFLKTNARMTLIQADDFTKAVTECIHESQHTHNEYSEKTKAAINQQNLSIRASVSQLVSYGNTIDSSEIPSLNIPELSKLKDLVEKIEQNPADRNLYLQEAISTYNPIESQIESKFEQLTFLDDFHDNIKKIEIALTELVNNIKKNLDNFLENLLALAGRQNTNQANLYTSMKKTLDDFDEVYSYVYKDGDFQTLNNFYKSKFREFENDYVPFSQVANQGHNMAQLTYTLPLELRLPRIYYCNLQAFVSGFSGFNIQLQYVHHSENGQEDILATTDDIRGGYRNPVSVNEMLIFELPTGRHFLYLRVIANGIASQLHIKDLAFDCLSYRNFHNQKHK